ncbi:MAG: nitroreductase family protein [Methylovirgula sp.]
MSDTNPRVADHPVDAQFLARWSPRAFTGEKIPESELRSLFEAARWAPSSSNLQPWRFFFALRGTPEFDTFLGLLNESNQVWAKTAGALLILASKSTNTPPGSDKPVPSRSHSFDTGAAWAYFALAAQQRGWAAHAMGGFDVERTRPALNLPEDFRPEAAIAVGRKGDPSTLSESQRKREAPSLRKPQSEFTFQGGFPPA